MKYTALENVGTLKLSVVRRGDLCNFVAVGFVTRDGSAKAGQDYIEVEGTIEFNPGESSKTIEVKIVDDQGYEQDEDFFVDLRNIKDTSKAQLGVVNSTQIIIIDDDEPGQIRFQEEQMIVSDSREDQFIEI